jgi:hypothetical protein
MAFKLYVVETFVEHRFETVWPAPNARGEAIRIQIDAQDKQRDIAWWLLSQGYLVRCYPVHDALRLSDVENSVGDILLREFAKRERP